jgi:TRAP-type uncharacterized transport system substrate-binding protein
VRRRALLAGVAAAVAVAAGLPVVAGRGGDGDDYPAGPLRIATGPPGGVYHAYGTGLAEAVRRELPRLDPAVSATAASVRNLRLVGTGRAEVGFALADSAADAVLAAARSTGRCRSSRWPASTTTTCSSSSARTGRCVPSPTCAGAAWTPGRPPPAPR